MAHVPAPRGAQYGRPPAYDYGYPGTQDYPGSQDYPTTQRPVSAPPSAYDDGWDAPTHTVSGAYLGPPDGADVQERGLSGWMAVLVLIVIAAIGGAVDLATGSNVKGGFNVGIVVASIVAILVVRRRSMFPVVVAPPLVYFGASAIMLYARSSGLHDRKVLLDAAANWLVYGFPAIAGATAAVLIIAGIRMFSGR